MDKTQAFNSRTGVKRRKIEQDNTLGVIDKKLSEFVYNESDDADTDVSDSDRPLLSSELNNILKDEEQDSNSSVSDEIGQKERTEFDHPFDQPDNIQITPFNLEEELEEGTFHASGTFLFDKKENKDQWIESINWDDVKKKDVKLSDEAIASSSGQTKNSSSNKNKDESLVISMDKLHNYKQMLRIMKPNETIQKTIRRLGDQIPKKGRQRKSNTQENSPGDIAEFRKKLDIMIESAHNCLEIGDVDIYQRTFDDLEDAIDV